MSDRVPIGDQSQAYQAHAPERCLLFRHSVDLSRLLQGIAQWEQAEPWRRIATLIRPRGRR